MEWGHVPTGETGWPKPLWARYPTRVSGPGSLIVESLCVHFMKLRDVVSDFGDPRKFKD